MGFQVGTKIDPRLMAVDYTPLIRANEMAAEQIAGMGKNIGNAISSYQDNKKQDKEFGQIVKSSLAMTDAMMQNLPADQAEPGRLRGSIEQAPCGYDRSYEDKAAR